MYNTEYQATSQKLVFAARMVLLGTLPTERTSSTLPLIHLRIDLVL
jgi:hypothetical protein